MYENYNIEYDSENVDISSFEKQDTPKNIDELIDKIKENEKDGVILSNEISVFYKIK